MKPSAAVQQRALFHPKTLVAAARGTIVRHPELRADQGCRAKWRTWSSAARDAVSHTSSLNRRPQSSDTPMGSEWKACHGTAATGRFRLRARDRRFAAAVRSIVQPDRSESTLRRGCGVEKKQRTVRPAGVA